jgi:hypothetical protein
MPTVTIGDNTTNTYAGCEDCELNLFFATTNLNGTSNELRIDSAYPAHMLIKFSGLSNITGPVSVSSATLYMQKTSENPSFYNPSANVYRVLRNWVDSEATWNQYSSGNNWTTGGCQSNGNDRVATPGTVSELGEALNTYHALSVPVADVEGWINGTFSNYGWLFELTSGASESFWTAASDSATNGVRPYLSVTYEEGGGGFQSAWAINANPHIL